MFWGFTFLSVGAIILINQIFGIDLPIFKILMGLFFIYIGLNIIFGSFGFSVNKTKTETKAIFTESQFKYPSKDEDPNEYNTVFGKSNLDLSSVEIGSESVELEINAVFGETKVKIKKGMPLRIKGTAAFGQMRFPNRDLSAMGEYTFESTDYKSGSPALIIKANVVFGSMKFEEI